MNDLGLTLNLIGSLLNLIGALLIALAFGKHPNGFGGTTTGEDGKEYHFSYLVHPCWFKAGLALLGFGFLMQFVASVLTRWGP